jgi:hypothetical protein
MICTWKDYVFTTGKLVISKHLKAIGMKKKTNGMKVFVKYINCLSVKNGNGFGGRRNLNGWLAITGHIHIGNKVGLSTIVNQFGFTSIYSDCFINDDSTCSQR